MKEVNISGEKRGFGTAPVFLTSISTILGAILFLRMGYATGVLGFWGMIAIILLGHMITIPTALAISELATNTRVEGGGEYFIISRSFGLKLGSTIGIMLYLSQTISIAFYTIAFTESFQPLFDWWAGYFDWELPRQAISVPVLLLVSWVMLKQGAGSGVKMLYIVVSLLFLSLAMFFMGDPIGSTPEIVEGMEGAIATVPEAINNFGFFNRDQFFILFAICFPAFTGMTAGVGLSGDLRNPGKSIPLGTMAGTIAGLVVYMLVAYKLAISAPQSALLGDQLVMSRIALFGSFMIYAGLAASTSSSAIGSMLVAPRTLQAIAADRIFPFRRFNIFLSKGRGRSREPYNASLISFAIALVFVLLGDVNSVAEIISMFFLITYGTLCLSSFLNHFGSPPSYRPRFRSRWYISLAGFVMSVWVMFKINAAYTLVSYIFIVLIYLFLEYRNKDKKGIVSIFKGALFQLNRRIQVYMQKHQSDMDTEEWRPAAICVSAHSFERDKVLDLMKWISYRHGFGTYFHYIEGYYSRQTHLEAKEIMERLIETQKNVGSTLYIDTIITPSYTSAIAQVIQSSSISGMENNLVLFEYDKGRPGELSHIIDNVNLVRAGDYDVCIFAGSDHMMRLSNGIHVWIRETDELNTNFMILLGYIIMSHPDWRRSHIKIFLTSPKGEMTEVKRDLEKRIAEGRLPITLANIEIVPITEGQRPCDVITTHSASAALTMIGFNKELIKSRPTEFFTDYDKLGDTLFVNCNSKKEIN